MGSGGKNRLTQEIVLAQFKEVHGDEFDYSKVVYIDTHTPVEVYCKKHNYIFFPTPKNHKNGAKCTICGRESQIKKAKKPQEKFKNEVIEKYGDRYDLSLVNYVNTKTPVKVICKYFGLIEILPASLLIKDKYEPRCAKRTKSTDKEMFIEEAIKVYGDKDDYTNTNIISSREKIEVRCKKHDVSFTKDIQTYLGGWGCPSCSAENYRKLRAIPKDEYYNRTNKKHNNLYTYNSDFTTTANTVTFFCKEHGKQRINAYSHLLGAGCKHCETEPFKTNRITKEGYAKLANGRDTFLYLIECYKGNEKFYKIGKTYRKLTQRFTNSNMPYKYKVIHKYADTAENIWDLEEELHNSYKEFSHRPRNWFAGYTECYNCLLPIQEIINLNL